MAQAYVSATLVVMGAAPLLAAVVALRQGWHPMGDNALIGLRVRDVLAGRFPLVGQPTTGATTGYGAASRHPGPLEFYVLAPFVAAFGSRVGLVAGAAVINSGALVSTGWLAVRRGGPALLGLASVATLLLVHSIGSDALVDPLSSTIATLPALALLWCVWSVLAGDLRVLPLGVAVASFTLQAHLAALSAGLIPTIAMFVAAIAWRWRGRSAAQQDPGCRRAVRIGLTLAVVLWLPVLLDQVTGSHNLTALGRSATRSEQPMGVRWAIGRAAVALAPVPLFARTSRGLEHLDPASTWQLVAGAAVACMLGLAARRASPRRGWSFGTMAFAAAVALAADVVAASSVTGSATLKPANLRWMWTTGTFVWMAALHGGWTMLRPTLRRRGQAPLLVLCAVATLGLVVANVGSVTTSARDGALARPLAHLSHDVVQRLPRGTYRVRFEGTSVPLTVGPTLVHDIEASGRTVYVAIGGYGRAYGANRQARQQPVDGTVVITSEFLASAPEGSRILASAQIDALGGAPEDHLITVLLDGRRR